MNTYIYVHTLARARAHTHVLWAQAQSEACVRLRLRACTRAHSDPGRPLSPSPLPPPSVPSATPFFTDCKVLQRKTCSYLLFHSSPVVFRLKQSYVHYPPRTKNKLQNDAKHATWCLMVCSAGICVREKHLHVLVFTSVSHNHRQRPTSIEYTRELEKKKKTKQNKQQQPNQCTMQAI